MSETNNMRTHNMAEIDINDLAAVRESVERAKAIGHHVRILAIYGDHLPACAVREAPPYEESPACNCGWAGAFDP